MCYIRIYLLSTFPCKGETYHAAVMILCQDDPINLRNRRFIHWVSCLWQHMRPKRGFSPSVGGSIQPDLWTVLQHSGSEGCHRAPLCRLHCEARAPLPFCLHFLSPPEGCGSPGSWVPAVTARRHLIPIPSQDSTGPSNCHPFPGNPSGKGCAG